IVADPNFAPMYANRSRRVKTDRRDARTLADACRLGAYRPAHRTSAAQRTVRAQLAVREALVRTRARYIRVIRAVLRRDGVRVPSGGAATFGPRVQALALSATQHRLIAPLLALLRSSTSSWPSWRRSSRARWQGTRRAGGCARSRAWAR